MLNNDSVFDSDQPITNSSQDAFGRDKFAKRIADVIIKRNDSGSIAIGIHAPWGDGKTSVLNMIVEQLTKHNVLYIRFNPWRFPDETKLLKNFFFELAAILDVSLETKGEKVSRIVRDNAKFFALGKIFGIDASDAIETFSDLVPEAEIEVLKERIEEKLEHTKKRIVIIMDDIDRLDKEEIQAVFRLVKLSANFPYTAYILSFDEKRVAEALKEKYGGDIEAGINFLEKIIQVSLPLPPVSSQSIMELTMHGIYAALNLSEIELSGEQKNRLLESFAKAFGQRLSTPRLSKRLANSLSFALPLMKGEVDEVDLIFIETIKVFYPKLYAVIRNDGDLIFNFDFELNFGQPVKKHEDELADLIIKSLDDIPERNQIGIKKLLQILFPQIRNLRSVFAYPYEVKAESNSFKAKRISNSQYFPRYFSYGVQPHDVSDLEVSNFLAQIAENDISFVIKKLEKYYQEDFERLYIFINKLRQEEDDLPLPIAKKLALAIAISINKLPSKELVKYENITNQLTRFLFNLINRVDGKEKATFFIEILNNISSAFAAFDLAESLHYLENSITSENMFSMAIGKEREINKLVASLINLEAKKESLELKYEMDNLQDLYMFWFYNDSITLSNYIQNRIKNGTEELLKVLAGIMRINLNPDKKYSSFTQRVANWPWIVESLVEPRLVIDSLKILFPNLNGVISDTNSNKENIANYFFQHYAQKI